MSIHFPRVCFLTILKFEKVSMVMTFKTMLITLLLFQIINKEIEW